MIKMTYDAVNGQPFADGRCDATVAGWIAQHVAGEDVEVVFASENILHAVRVAIRRGQLGCTDVALFFEDVQPVIYPSGGIAPWPEGFCDHTERWLLELL